jgi:hypothetical protein
MFAISDKAKHDVENIRELKLVLIRRVNVQVIKLVFQPELPLMVNKLLYRAWTKRGTVYVLSIYEL